jgi:anti-sigma B factor antagonist
MHNDPCQLQEVPGQKPTTRILRLCGPLVLQNIFEIQQELQKNRQPLTIFDLTEVPYMDSAGMGVITNYYVSATNHGHKVIVAGASQRILEVFKLTRVDTIIPLVATVEEAESRA